MEKFAPEASGTPREEFMKKLLARPSGKFQTPVPARQMENHDSLNSLIDIIRALKEESDEVTYQDHSNDNGAYADRSDDTMGLNDDRVGADETVNDVDYTESANFVDSPAFQKMVDDLLQKVKAELPGRMDNMDQWGDLDRDDTSYNHQEAPMTVIKRSSRECIKGYCDHLDKYTAKRYNCIMKKCNRRSLVW